MVTLVTFAIDKRIPKKIIDLSHKPGYHERVIRGVTFVPPHL